jgi:hypothetical protein
MHALCAAHTQLLLPLLLQLLLLLLLLHFLIQYALLPSARCTTSTSVQPLLPVTTKTCVRCAARWQTTLQLCQRVVQLLLLVKSSNTRLCNVSVNSFAIVYRLT